MAGRIKLNFSGRDCTDKSVSLVTTGSVGTVTAAFGFDAEWEGFARTAIFSSGGTVKRVVLDDANACVVPWEVLTNCKQLTIGVVGTSGNRVLPSVPVTIPIIEGVCNGGTPPDDPTPDIYAQLLDRAKETQQIAQSVRDDANAGKFNGAPGAKGGKGDPGADGKTPVKGVDYWTEAEKKDIAANAAALVDAPANIKDGSGAGSLRMNNTTAVTESDDGGQEYRPQTPETPTPRAYGADAFAVGSGTRADGDASTAEGVLTVAGYVRANKTRSVGAHAEGEGTYAKSSASHAEGYHTQALASNSHTEGFFTQVNADGWSGHAEGRETVVNGRAGHAEGYLTQANGTEAHAEGMSTVASGDHSHAEGMSSVASGLGAHVEGATTTAGVGNKATAKGAHAEGVGTTASGEDSHAEGAKTTASGLHSHAEGFSTNAIGNVSHAEGDRTTADGSAGHAEGCLTTAKYRSHAEGEKTVAGGGTTGTRGAHAEGVETQALAFASHAGGVGSVVDNYASTAIGSYPRQIAGTPAKYNRNAVAFAVGNGTGDTARSNAFEVSFNGTGRLGGQKILTQGNISADAVLGDSASVATEDTSNGIAFHFSIPKGYTPVRGADYWTAEDIAVIKGYVDTAILGGAW